MAKLLKQGLERKRIDRYPWSTWTDGKARRAKRGVDFVCPASSFITSLRMHSRTYGIDVIALKVDEDTVDFQFPNA